MLYFVKNETGNVSDVTERIYNYCKDKSNYECWTEDPYADIPEEVEEISYGKSTDYSAVELRKMRSDFSDPEWEQFTKDDKRKTETY